MSVSGASGASARAGAAYGGAAGSGAAGSGSGAAGSDRLDPAAGRTEPDRVSGVARLIFLVMIASGTLTVVVGAIDGRQAAWSMFAVVALAALCFAALYWWRRAGPLLVRHPSAVLVFLLGTLCVVPSVGASTPIIFMIFSICLLAGLMYDWRGQVLFPAVAAIGWWAVVSIGIDMPSAGTMIGTPLLIVLATVGGAAQRRLLERQALVERRFRDAARASALADERARVARDMHDLVIKTLYGVSLHAEAIAAWVDRDPQTAAATARHLAGEASDTASRVRALIGELRAATDDGPAGRQVADACRQWSSVTGIPVTDDADEGVVLAPEAATDLYRVLGEALENVRRHAGATAVDVTLKRSGGGTELRVVDDGRGIALGAPAQAGPGSAAAPGHFGIVGMQERAARHGGVLDVANLPGERGCVVRLWLPGDADGAGGLARDGDGDE